MTVTMGELNQSLDKAKAVLALLQKVHNEAKLQLGATTLMRRATEAMSMGDIKASNRQTALVLKSPEYAIMTSVADLVTKQEGIITKLEAQLLPGARPTSGNGDDGDDDDSANS